jgi:hypothetical protein
MNPILTRQAPGWLSFTIISLAVATVIMFLNIVFPGIELYRDCAFVCEYTGSRKGYREWCFGERTHCWNDESTVETTIKRHFPDQLQNKWTMFGGTGYSAWGSAVSFGHGRPGTIVAIPVTVMNNYCGTLSTQEVMSLYNLMRYGSPKAKELEVRRIMEFWMENALFHTPIRP